LFIFQLPVVKLLDITMPIIPLCIRKQNIHKLFRIWSDKNYYYYNIIILLLLYSFRQGDAFSIHWQQYR